MNYIIREMEELDLTNHRVWGSKASYIADGKKRGLPIPEGFCISLKGLDVKLDQAGFLEEVNRFFQRLQEKTRALRYIVRSSAQYEDRPDHIFPGIYKSKKDIRNFSELREALQSCYAGFHSKVSELYMKNMNLAQGRQEYFCLIVQEQIEPEYSGVVFTHVPVPEYDCPGSYLVELAKGHCQDVIQGKEQSNAYIIEGKQEEPFLIRRLMSTDIAHDHVEKIILPELGKLVGKIIEFYGQNLDIEWGYSQGKLIVFQIRLLLNKDSKLQNENAKADIGMKAEAMKRFHAMDLFQKKLLVIEQAGSITEILHRIEHAKWLDGQITVRYSHDRRLGLPRYFAPNKEKAVEFIRKTWQTGWTIIIHESIDVKHSFELYMDHEKTILEHIPGMWESDNKSAADLWIFQDGTVTAYAADMERTARYESSGLKSYQVVKPYHEVEMKQIASAVFPYIQFLRREWTIEESVNFHFVCDDNEHFFFLNHRKISKIPNWYEKQKELTVIRSREDFKKWNGGNILLKIDLKRGEEDLIGEYVPFLKRANVRVYVQFGILSHPSILLREMGIEVYPEYSHHKKYIYTLDEGNNWKVQGL